MNMSDNLYFDRSSRSRLEVLGPDRGKFLHNLTTNEIKRLPKGEGCEAFITSPQGKTLAYVIVLADDPQHLVRADAGGLAVALPHLRKYGMFDDVTLEDVGEATFETHLIGKNLEAISGHAEPMKPYHHLRREFAGHPVWVIAESPTGRPGLTLIGRSVDRSVIENGLEAQGFQAGSPTLFDQLRIEAGTPVFGQDITPENLPQEIARDRQAINFTKGCYLGQETVARIDALGHVNKILRRLELVGGTELTVGTPLLHEGKSVGHVTSVATIEGKAIGLGIVRLTLATAGTELEVDSVGQPGRVKVRDPS